jgi:hypothetical protein
MYGYVQDLLCTKFHTCSTPLQLFITYCHQRNTKLHILQDLLMYIISELHISLADVPEVCMSVMLLYIVINLNGGRVASSGIVST